MVSWFLPKELYLEKAALALDSVFEQRDNIVLSKVKSEARKLCNEIGLEKFARSLDKAKNLSLDVFFQRQNAQSGSAISSDRFGNRRLAKTGGQILTR